MMVSDERHKPNLSLRLVVALFFLLTSTVAAADDTAKNSRNSLSPGNPFYSGCLYQKDNADGNRRVRVCNSNDPPEALQQNLCRKPDFDYMEIRVAVGNWDSATMLGWLTQLVLSEIAGIPSTIEAGMYDSSRDFYDVEGKIDYDTGLGATALATAANQINVDCRKVPKLPGDAYENCAHFFPEYWGEPTDMIAEIKVEPSQATGFLGHETWFVTKFTAHEFPQFVSYHGLERPENRELLAATFKRPTTWLQYCEEVSIDNCTTPDDVAQRPPQTGIESQRMFVPAGDSFFGVSETPLYTGHFRYTEKNNCTLYPTNCTGHIANYPCGWKSNMESQIYYQNIALDPNNRPDGGPNGYSESQLKEMWHAANYTRSHLMMQWWQPEPLYQHFLGTDAEMQQVTRRPYTRDCAVAREIYKDECADDFVDRIGEPEEACGDPVEPLRKLINVGLREAMESPGIPEEAKSPAYDILRFFAVTEIQLGELFDAWEAGPTPREGVCEWAIANLDKVLGRMIPPTYPRVVRDEGHSSFGVAVMIVGGIATLVVLVTGFFVFQNSEAPSIQYAQTDFLGVLLLGSLMVSVGSILLSAPASKGTCTATIWFIFLGYNIELLPLILKVAAINRLMSAARDLRRIVIGRASLYGTLISICLGVAIYLALWTVFGSPHAVVEYSITDSVTELDEVVVDKSYFCYSGNPAWGLAALAWNGILLICASVLAFQARNAVSSFNETRTLAMLVYSHFIFLLARVAMMFLGSQVSGSTIVYSLSLVYALDQITACAIYFLPKFILHDTDKEGSSNSQSFTKETKWSRYRGGSMNAHTQPNAVEQLRDAAREASERFSLKDGENAQPNNHARSRSFDDPSSLSVDLVIEEGEGDDTQTDSRDVEESDGVGVAEEDPLSQSNEVVKA
ncbi:MAG: hypothetical protein SGILL_005633 [Bacillariaceae sp.]